MTGNQQRQQAWSLQTLDRQLRDLHRTHLGPLHLGVGCVICVAPNSGTRTCPWCISWLFGAYSLWWDGLFSFEAEVGSLVVPQLDMPCFVDAWRKPYPNLNGYGMESEWGLGGRWGMEGKTVVHMENKIKMFYRNFYVTQWQESKKWNYCILTWILWIMKGKIVL